MKERKIRVLIAKIGLDGHDRGAKVLTMGLRDEGMEVIYMGLKQTAESIVEAAIEEDVDVVGLSSLSGGHQYHFPRVTGMLKEKGAGRVLVIGGGLSRKKISPSFRRRG